MKHLELKMAHNKENGCSPIVYSQHSQENVYDFPRVYTLHSQKGGVGKTSIALAIAGFAAFHNDKKTLIIDADLTGTSLLDIPETVSDHGKKYFNDFILANPSEFGKHTPVTSDQAKQKAEDTEKKFCWNIPKGNGKIFCMPGSPLVEDMQKIVPLISQEDHLKFFRHRLEDILATATLAGFEVIIIDHSPGLLGLSKASLLMVADQAVSHFGEEKHPNGPTRLDRLYRASASGVSKIRIAANAILVTTFDPVDYRASVPSYSFILAKMKKGLNSLDALYGCVDMIFNKVPEHLEPVFEIPKVLNEVKGLPGRNVHEDLIGYFDARAKEVGADVATNVENFEMSRILEAVKNLKTKQEPEYAQWENWCYHVGKASRLYVKPREKLLAAKKDHEKNNSQ
jgi:cellulose biosynthesis protein BcsQ